VNLTVNRGHGGEAECLQGRQTAEPRAINETSTVVPARTTERRARGRGVRGRVDVRRAGPSLAIENQSRGASRRTTVAERVDVIDALAVRLRP